MITKILLGICLLSTSVVTSCSEKGDTQEKLGYLQADTNFPCYNDLDPSSRNYSVEMRDASGGAIDFSSTPELTVFDEESFQTGFCKLSIVFSGFPSSNPPFEVTFYRDGQVLETETFTKSEIEYVSP